MGPSVISTPATAPVAPAAPAVRWVPAAPALRRAAVAPAAAAASPPAPVPVTTSYAGKQFSTFLLFQVSVSCRHGNLYDNFSVSDIYTDESSSGSSGAHDLEAQMEEVERFAVDTAVLSEAPTILDSGATDKNNNNNDFWTKEDAVVISDKEEEEGNGCEWGSIYFFSQFNSVYEWPKLSLVIAAVLGCSREVADILSGLGVDVSEAPATKAPALYDPLTTPASEGPTLGEFH